MNLRHYFAVICLAIFVTLPTLAQPQPSQARQDVIAAALQKAQQEQTQIRRIVILQQTKAYVIDLPIYMVQQGPKNLVTCAKGALGAAVETAKELCYTVYDTAVATALGAKMFFGSETAKEQAQIYVPKSGLYHAVKNQGWGATVREMPRAIFESTIGNLLSGDPEKAGRFITNTAILLAPAPKTVAALQNTFKTTMGAGSLTMNPQGALAFAGATTYSINSEALAAVAGAMVQEAAAMGPLSSVMMSQGTPTGRQIWGDWDCPTCGTKGISARPQAGETNASCPGCGKGKPSGTKHYLKDGERDSKGKIVDKSDDVRGEAEKKVANGGKDWSCGSCGTANKAIHGSCGACGAPKSAAVTPKTNVTELPKPASGISSTQITAGTLGLAALGGGAAYYFLKTTVVDGTMISKSWQHTSSLEEFTKTTKTAWKNEIHLQSPRMPVNGSGEIAGAFNLHNCHESQRSTRQVACGSEPYTIPGSCSYVDNGNGSFSEVCSADTTGSRTIYCDEPVNDTLCSYETYQWQNRLTKSLSGTEKEKGPLPWPELGQPSPSQRISRSSSYSVSIEYAYRGERQVHQHTLSSESQFLNHEIGERFQLEVSRLYVKGVKRLKDIISSR